LGIGISSLIQIGRRWWWLLVIGPLLGMVFGYALASRQVPQYAATTQLMLTPSGGTSGIDNGTLEGTQSLAITYQQLIVSAPVLEPVIANLKLPYTVDELRAKVTPSVVPSTVLINITVSDENPDQAAEIANAISKQFQDYILFQSTSVNVDVVQAVPAKAPTSPYAPRTPLYVALGLILGSLFICSAIALIEFLDKSVRNASEATSLLGRPVLSSLPYDPNFRRYPENYLPFLSNPDDPFAEAIRHLRTRIARQHSPGSKFILVVTSPRSHEGKSTVAANLGISLAQAGFLVGLVDANLRHPSLHELFGVNNERGLSSLTTRPDQTWPRAAAEVGAPNLVLVPSGPPLPDSIELLDGARLHKVLMAMKDELDIILIDTPALLEFSDGIAAAKQADSAIIVCRPGRTARHDLQAAAMSLRDASVEIEGMVLNHQRSRTRFFLPIRVGTSTQQNLNGYSSHEEEPSMEPSLPR
jgi:succinoglycan biosynthesis transport protein ExoP